ncbi:exodeoxyribonuclease VII large subunit [Candidatus Nomurabacteria bacterium]|nr:exodeoxyribonuclease VII large subunit [Candidatus Saccharibacteria bacterium]MCB9839576.1 exodeoxyribonuclease VII large subunit [Candidatus Nomurabacteria bacterium]
MNEQSKLVFTPTDFVAITNQVFETAFGFSYIEGELANFRISKNKWLYFDIKDATSKVSCFGSVYAMPGPLEEGMTVVVGGRATMHPQFGFNFTIQSIAPSGQGSIKKAFDLLKAKLTAEGLFEEARKRSVPYPPNNIALVTSLESAAYADFIKVLSHRWPFANLAVYDSLVQGDQAPAQLVNAISDANSNEVLADVLVITRGGGSADDLSAFNDERVVRAVASSRIPTVVAIGHEVDESLAELASDKRASTPSNAAELLVPDRQAEARQILGLKPRLSSSFKTVITSNLENNQRSLENIKSIFNDKLRTAEAELDLSKHRLELLNPRSVLKKGYSVVRQTGGAVVKNSKSLNVGQNIELIFYQGSAKAEVKEILK